MSRLRRSFPGGTPPDPQGRLRRALGHWSPVKQNKRFLEMLSMSKGARGAKVLFKGTVLCSVTVSQC
jgi:hypothetical protein